ncbi:expressed unknown protein [Seminavis robusta]|uniref:Uncharacterized protein n=1 Tax=Seminavis robusta TaxID=568900 RepID=A0A9N8DPH7_9STRA|nr:expressed unknown protein [Seminavis robusta]|eukprot:Sro262_g102020.1 n/a (180) ;mRNA; r:40722-41450
MHSLGALFAVLLASNSNNVEFLKQRLLIGYDAAAEATSFLEDQEYEKASRSFADALNLGRKPALKLQELDDEETKQEALQWLIDVCCDSALLHLVHLEDLDSARKDAFAALVFSQYEQLKPLQCMIKVCEKGDDLFGEFQALQRVLQLPTEEMEDDDQRKAISDRLEEIEALLSNSKNE